MSGVLLVGDSQAQGLVGPLASAGVAIVGTVAQQGIGTAALASSGDVGAAAQAFRPDLVLVVLGGNDSAGPALERAIAELRTQLSGNVVWVGPMSSSDVDVDARHARVAITQQGLARSLGYRWIDGRALSQDLTHSADGVHFTAAARTTLARRIVAQINASPARLGWALGLGAVAALGFGGLAWIWSRS